MKISTIVTAGVVVSVITVSFLVISKGNKKKEYHEIKREKRQKEIDEELEERIRKNEENLQERIKEEK